MNSHLKPVYTAQMLTGAKGALTVVGAMGTEMQTKMLPALGQQLGMDQAQLQGFFQQNLPAMAAGMQTMPQALGRFQNLLRTFDGHLSDYNTLQPVSFVPIVWTMIIGGVVAMFAGALGLVARRKPEIRRFRSRRSGPHKGCPAARFFPGTGRGRRKAMDSPSFLPAAPFPYESIAR